MTKLPQIGFSFHSHGGVTYVAGGARPAFLAWVIVATILLLTLLSFRAENAPDGIPSLGRRYAASIIDFFFVLGILAPVGGMLALWIEAARTGRFVWQFERDYYVGTDELIGVPLVLISLALMFLYFVWPLTKGKQTVGCFILRLKTTPPFGNQGAFTFRQAVRRVWFEFQGGLSILQLREGRDGQGRTWYDQKTNCTVLLVRYE